jgi:hypothetical protein
VTPWQCWCRKGMVNSIRCCRTQVLNLAINIRRVVSTYVFSCFHPHERYQDFKAIYNANQFQFVQETFRWILNLIRAYRNDRIQAGMTSLD